MSTSMFFLPDIDATYCVHEFKRAECALCTEPTPTLGLANRATVERMAGTSVAKRLLGRPEPIVAPIAEPIASDPILGALILAAARLFSSHNRRD